MKNKLQIFTLFVFVAVIQMMSASPVRAVSCGGCRANPASGTISTSFTVAGNGCIPETNINSVTIYNNATNSSVFTVPITITAPPSGTFSVSIPAIGTVGSYTVLVTDGAAQSHSCGNFTVENVANTTPLKCGDKTSSLSNACPTNCRSTLLSASTYFCSCGGIGQPCCPAGNTAGQQACSQSGSRCQSTNICSERSGGSGVDTQFTSIKTCVTESGSGIPTAIGCVPISDITALTSFFMKWLLGIGGGIAFIMILVAGFQIMTAGGDPKRLTSGQELLTSAVSGLILIIFSIFILRLIGVNVLGLF